MATVLYNLYSKFNCSLVHSNAIALLAQSVLLTAQMILVIDLFTIWFVCNSCIYVCMYITNKIKLAGVLNLE